MLCPIINDKNTLIDLALIKTINKLHMGHFGLLPRQRETRDYLVFLILIII